MVERVYHHSHEKSLHYIHKYPQHQRLVSIDYHQFLQLSGPVTLVRAFKPRVSDRKNRVNAQGRTQSPSSQSGRRNYWQITTCSARRYPRLKLGLQFGVSRRRQMTQMPLLTNDSARLACGVADRSGLTAVSTPSCGGGLNFS